MVDGLGLKDDILAHTTRGESVASRASPPTGSSYIAVADHVGLTLVVANMWKSVRVCTPRGCIPREMHSDQEPGRSVAARANWLTLNLLPLPPRLRKFTSSAYKLGSTSETSLIKLSWIVPGAQDTPSDGS